MGDGFKDRLVREHALKISVTVKILMYLNPYIIFHKNPKSLGSIDDFVGSYKSA